YVFFFFFFQAEDGIRDYKVTGVQTCALPIFLLLVLAAACFAAFIAIDGIPRYPVQKVDLKVEVTPERVARGKIISNMLCKQCHRSEERRVGKECRCWW